MASSILCQKGLQEQFVAKSNGGRYVWCSNGGCGYFCSLVDLLAYRRVVQLDVASAFMGRDAPLCQHKKACTLRVSRLPKNGSRPYFVCQEHWPCTFFCWADLEVSLQPLPSHKTL